MSTGKWKDHTPMAGTQVHNSWKGMKTRCDNPKANTYINYGARGISYDPRWKEFKNFLEDMGERPENMSLDRIDNEKGYSKENCRWATASQQLKNRRSYIWKKYRAQLEVGAGETLRGTTSGTGNTF